MIVAFWGAEGLLLTRGLVGGKETGKMSLVHDKAWEIEAIKERKKCQVVRFTAKLGK